VVIQALREKGKHKNNDVTKQRAKGHSQIIKEERIRNRVQSLPVCLVSRRLATE
jgi:hypothetical protein